MAAQLPVIGVFAILWLPRAPAQGLLVLGLHVLALVANFATLRYFEL